MKRLLPPPGTVLLTSAVLATTWSLVEREHAAELLSKAVTNAPLAASDTARPQEWTPSTRDDRFYEVIEARPLFSEGRRPHNPETDTTAVETPTRTPSTRAPVEARVAIKPPQLRLKGLMVDATHRSALIEWPQGEARWYSEQTEIDGWSIAEISTRGVQLTRENKVHRITLYETD